MKEEKEKALEAEKEKFKEEPEQFNEEAWEK